MNNKKSFILFFSWLQDLWANLLYRFTEFQPKLSKWIDIYNSSLFKLSYTCLQVCKQLWSLLFILIVVSDTRRALNSDNEQPKSGVYLFFFTISQLGGLCAFFIVTLGFILRPVLDKFFQREVVNDWHLRNQEDISQLMKEFHVLNSRVARFGRIPAGKLRIYLENSIRNIKGLYLC